MCGEEISMTICSAVLIQYQRVTDRQTDGETDVQPISITCFSIADARKNRFRPAGASPESSCLKCRFPSIGEVCGMACRAKPPNADAPVFLPANICHNMFLSTFFVLLNLVTITLTYFTITIIIRTGTKTRTTDYNREKIALNFSFVRILLQVALSDTSWFWTTL